MGKKKSSTLRLNFADKESRVINLATMMQEYGNMNQHERRTFKDSLTYNRVNREDQNHGTFLICTTVGLNQNFKEMVENK